MVFKMKDRSKEESLKGFYRESRARGYQGSVDRGIQVVEITEVVGSVGRSLSFNRDFSIKDPGNVPHALGRVAKIEEALERGEALPPIELYKMDDEYYVLDGHHRIIAAKKQGQKFIDAHVTEYLPLRNAAGRSFIQKRIEFEEETGLQSISLSHRESYNKLLRQIENYKNLLEQKGDNGVSFKEAAQDWFEAIYRPVAQKIRNINLKEYLPGARTSDIYVYLCSQINLHHPRAGRCGADLKETLEELAIVAEATRAVFSKKGLKEKILRIFRARF